MNTDILSSDVLEGQFGETRVEILFQDEQERIITTVADEVILELSWVRFVTEGVQAYPDVHKVVVDGQSMGKAFREAGVPFVRKTKSVRQASLPSVLLGKFGAKGKATVVEVDILVGDREVPYARILETYSPRVNWPGEVTHTDASLPKITEFAQRLKDL